MNELFYYNPENDIALAVNPNGSFTPPRQAALLARYGAPLMWWMGDKTDYVLLPDDMSPHETSRLAGWNSLVSGRYGDGPVLVSDCNGLPVKKISPWGWSRPATDRLIRAGTDASLVSGVNVDTIRSLSHRHTAGLVNEALRSSLGSAWGPFLCAEPAFEARSAAEASAYISSVDTSDLYIKAPWSSSGRGVVSSRFLTPLQLLTRCEGVIRRQGSVLIERGYNKLMDFAMLFEAGEAGQIRFIGMSSFFNGRDVSYNGNLVASDSSIIACLCRYIPETLIFGLIGYLPVILTAILAGEYRGYMGIDMMVISSDSSSSGFALVPCVELNLRMTMGVVAHRLFSRMGNISGVMKVHPFTDRAATLPENALPLVPLNECFNIIFIPEPPLRREV